MNWDAIVIGGGVIGCSVSLRLRQAGLKVMMLERGQVGREASRAAAGMLSPQTEASEPGPFFDLCLRSRAMYPTFADEIRSISGIDSQYRDEGSLFLTFDESEAAAIERWTTWQTEAGLAIERLAIDTIQRLEPSVTKAATGAVFVPGDHQIDNRLLMNALEVAARRAGVEVIEDKGADSLSVEGSRIAGVVCGHERYTAGSVVIAAGCWSSALLETAGLIIRVTPARGQMIAVKGDRLPIRSLVHSKRCYLVPRSDGRVLIGATVEYVGFEKGVTAGGIRSLLDAAIELVPEIGGFEIVETWSGLRPDTVDHLPVLGPVGPDNLFLSTGHFRNGILLAPVTAVLISDAIINGRMPDELMPFSATRDGLQAHD